MLRKDIAPIVGVGRNKVGEWITAWQEGGIRALKVGKAGAPKGSGLRLNHFEQERIRKTIIKDAPDQLKLPFALWTREAVRQLIEQIYGIDLPIRSVGNYLQKWGFSPQKPVKRAYERDDKKVRKWLEEDFPALAKRAKAEGGEVHWGDETGVKSEDQVGRGYAPKGQTPVRKHRGSPEKSNMISTVTNQGKVRFMFYDGSMNADRLIEFLRRLIRSASRKVFLVLDNLRVHHAEAQIPSDRVIDGKDITPTLIQGAKSPHEAFFYHAKNQLAAVRSGKWKLHLGIKSKRGKNMPSLYDLESDIGETNNVFKGHPKIVQELLSHTETFNAEITRNTRPAGLVKNAKALTTHKK